MTNIFVGNLPFAVDDEQLASAFAQYGAVQSAEVIRDRDSGQSRGFGFVLMKDDREALLAIQEHHGREWDGRTIKVNVARETPRRNSRLVLSPQTPLRTDRL